MENKQNKPSPGNNESKNEPKEQTNHMVQAKEKAEMYYLINYKNYLLKLEL